jgi:RNA polymerase sigma factor (TIGR02999 family)
MDVTTLLLAWQAGDDAALARASSLVYRELRRLAGGHLRGEREGHTLQPTALVHEAFLRLVDQKRVRWKSRLHFFSIASHLMRRILVDHARRRRADKRHGQAMAVSLEDAPDVAKPTDVDLVRLDDALLALSKLDIRQSRVVELRYFGGLTIEETAEVLQVSPATVKLDWKMAKAWLFDELRG